MNLTLHTRARVAITSAVAVIAAGMALTSGTSWAAGPANITGNLSGDAIFGCGFAANSSVAEVVRTLPPPDGTVAWSGNASTNENGCFNTNLRPQTPPVDLQPGMYISAQDGTTTKELTLVNVSIDTIDPGTNTVAGAAPEGAVSVHANVGGTNENGQPTASGGSWSYQFTTIDIQPSTMVDANVADGDGDSTGFSKQAFAGNVQVSLNNDSVGGWGFTPNSTATVQVRQSSGGSVLYDRSDVATGSQGNFNINLGPGTDVVPGMYVKATDNSSAYYKELTVANVTIDTINVDTDTVSGHAPDGPVNVNATITWGTPPVGGSATASGGTWSYHFGVDIVTTTMINASAPDADGDQTFVSRALFAGNIQANLTGDSVGVWGFTANATVTMVVRQTPGGSILFNRSDVATGSQGNFNLNMGPAINLAPGMYVKVTDNTTSYYKELTLVNISIDTINVDTDTVSGTAPDGQVNLMANIGNQPVNGQTTATSGHWSYQFAVDIIQTTVIGATVNDTDGDGTGVNRAMFNGHINADLAGDNLNGQGFTANHTVTVLLRQTPTGTVLLDRSDVATDGSGSFNLNLAPDINLQPGMYVKVTDPSTTYFKELTFASLSIDTIDTDTDTVTGTAPDGMVGVSANIPDSGGQTTASGGHWSYHFTVDIVATTNINAGVSDADGDNTNVNRAMFNGHINADLSGDGMGGWGFTPDSTVSVLVKQSPAGAVLVNRADVPTDGNGNFNLEPQPGVDLTPGMYAKVTDNSSAYFKELTFANLSIDTIDVAANTASGTAPDGQVWLGADVGGGTGGPTTATGGHWTYQFSVDILPTTNINANVNDNDGDSTGVNRALFSANINVDLSNNNVSGWGFTPNNWVSLLVKDAPNGTPLFNQSLPTDSEGNFQTDPFGTLTLAAGMYVKATDESSSNFKELTIANLSIDAINVDTNTVSGTAPDGQVDVNADIGDGAGGQATATGGHWTYQFSVDILPTTNINANVNDGDGDSTGVNRALFSGNIYADLSYNNVSGWGFTAGGHATVEIKSSPGGTTLFTEDLTIDPDSSFYVELQGTGVQLSPGMYVKVTDASGFFKELTVVSLSIDTIDVATDTVSGTAPNGQVWVDADIGDGVGGEATVTNNQWSYHFDVDILPTTNINANVNDIDGDNTSVNKALFSGNLGVDMTNDNVGGWGFTPGHLVTVVVRQSPSGTELFNNDVLADDWGGGFGLDLRGILDLVPGMFVSATDKATGYAKTVLLPNLSIDAIDAATDTVAGTAPDGPVQIGADIPGFQGDEVTATGGHWTYHFGVDITVGTTIYAGINDADGDNVGVNRALDGAGPNLLSLQLPGSVSLSGAPGTATATAQVADDVSGFQQGWLYFTGPDGWQSTSASFGYTDPHSADGTYSVDVPLPGDAGSGTWTLVAVDIRDQAGNTTSYTTGSFPAQVATSFTVDNTVTPTETGSVSGTVTGPSGPLAGASVNVCRSIGFPCAGSTTAGDGTYQATSLPDGDYIVSVFPPQGSSLNAAQGAGTVSGGGAATVDVALKAPDAITPADDVSVNGQTSGVPSVNWQSSINLAVDACPAGTATYTITDELGDLIPNGSGTMTESDTTPGHYYYSVPAPYPSHGTMTVDISVSCPNPAQDTSPSFTLYVDPSGFVKDQQGHEIAGATVTLLRSDTANGTYTAVPNGSEIMSPSNRTNPMTTDATGHYGWDVSAGYYKVSVAKAGCYAPNSYDVATNTVTSSVMSSAQQIPPAVTNLNLTLDCTNIAPVAAFNQSANAVKAGSSVHFDASGSSDANGTIASYTWDFGDGSPVAHGVSVNHTYATVGNFTPTLTVTDDQGLQSAEKTGSQIAVGDVPGPVRGLTATTAVRTVTLSWTAPSADNNSTITGYKVDVSPGGQHLTTTGTTLRIGGLTGTTYTFTVAAVNDYGAGPVRSITARWAGRRPAGLL